MKNGICVIRAFGKCLKGFVSRQNQQIDASAVCFFLQDSVSSSLTLAKHHYRTAVGV